jgi:quinol monooxygenase YgiN
MILVVGRIVVQEDRLDDALASCLEHVERSRAEPGCISHDVHQDVENPRRVVFVERWTDSAALARHFAVPASGAFVRTIAELAAETPSIAIYEASELPAPELAGGSGQARQRPR